MDKNITDFKKLKISVPKFREQLFDNKFLDLLLYVNDNIYITLLSTNQEPINFKLLNTQFISSTIIDNNKNKLFFKHKYEIKINSFSVSLIVMSSKKKINVKKIALKIGIMYLYSQFNGEIEILLLLLKDKKQFSKPLLTYDNINSGYTEFLSKTKKKIVIFRQEELQKVLVHELIHCFDLDLLSKNVSLNLNILNYFKVNPHDTFEINEAYTDFWAILINCLLECMIEHKQFISYFKKKFELERKFTLFQTAKILLLLGFNNIEEFKNINDYPDNLVWTQKTPAFSYFFIKASMFYNINIFIKENIKNKMNYKNTIVKLILDSSFFKEIDTIMLKIKQNKVKNKYLLKTSRMTINNYI